MSVGGFYPGCDADRRGKSLLQGDCPEPRNFLTSTEMCLYCKIGVTQSHGKVWKGPHKLTSQDEGKPSEARVCVVCNWQLCNC